MKHMNSLVIIGILMTLSSALEMQEMKKLKIFPGTFWCGAGNLAKGSNELGIFQGPDLCCRAHDLCPVKLRPFRSGFGLYNARPHTALHCSCDEAFRNCLRIDGSAHSRTVGEFYFDHLKAPCFTLKKGKRCLKRTWWGKCTKEDDKQIIGQWHSALRFEQ